MLSVVASWAHDVEIDGIYYNLDETNKTAEVTYRGNSPDTYISEYIGDVVIPASIVYNSEVYNVTSIGEYAFYKCIYLTDIVIPEGVISIGDYAFESCINLKNKIMPEIATPSADSVTIAIYVPANTCNGVILVGAGVGENGTDDWYPEEMNNPFKPLEGEERWFTITIAHNDALAVKAIAITDEGRANWSYQWGGNIDGESENVTLLSGTAFLDTSENGGEVKLTSLEKGEVVFIAVKAWKSAPCEERNQAGEATFTLTAPELPEGAVVGIVGELTDDLLWDINYPILMTKVDANTWTATTEVKAACKYKYFVSLDGGVSWDWSIGEYGSDREMSFDLIAIDTVEAWRGLPDAETRSVMTTEGDSILIIPNSVREIGNAAFKECINLSSISLGANVKSIGKEAFSNTKMYNSESSWEEGVLYLDNYLIEASNNEVKGDYSIKEGTILIADYAFASCDNLVSIVIPNSVKSIGDYAFYDCENITKVNYLGSVDEWVDIDKDYYTLWNAKDLYINNELLTDVVITSSDSIKDYAFKNCQSIKTVELGSSVKYIGAISFQECSGLTSLSIGENVSFVGFGAFSGCSNLKNVTAYPVVVPKTAGEDYITSIFGTYISYLNVPCESLEAYELDNVFGQFKYIRCIEEEEEAPEDVEIEVDDNGNVNIKWPPTEGANSYKLVVSHAGNVICTLQFNSMGQLTSIDLGTRAANVGFEFTVTGLTKGSKYSYEMTALTANEEVLEYYAGAFITNGYEEGDDDVTTSVEEALSDVIISASNGLITCSEVNIAIYNVSGQNVTAQNGALTSGVYMVQVGDAYIKVLMK